MQVSVLCSGSKGNCTFIKTNDYNFLIDVGKNIKYIEEKLNNFNFSFRDINFILLTHLHEDHISSLRHLNNKKIVIYVTKKMYDTLFKINPELNYFIYNENIILDNINIKIINTSHDSIDNRGFLINDSNSSLVYITDTGYLNSKYFQVLKNKTMYILESNHDIMKLRNSKYPVWLQNRILSDKGHLANEVASGYLARLIGADTKAIILAHLSEENNSEELALQAFKTKLKEYDLMFENVVCARPEEATGMYEL